MNKIIYSTEYIGDNVKLFKDGENVIFISIKDIWYKVLSLNDCICKDGYYRFIYFTLNIENNDFYIGKCCRKDKKSCSSYRGSGTNIKINLKNGLNVKTLKKYIILKCETEDEAFDKELQIVDNELRQNKKCLNRINGGKYNDTIVRWYKNNPDKNLERIRKCRNAINSEEYKKRASKNGKMMWENYDYRTLQTKNNVKITSSKSVKRKISNSLKQYFVDNVEKKNERNNKIGLANSDIIILTLQDGREIYFNGQTKAAEFLINLGITKSKISDNVRITLLNSLKHNKTVYGLKCKSIKKTKSKIEKLTFSEDSVKIYNSISEAAKDIKCSNSSYVSTIISCIKSCIDGKQVSAYGFKWKYC